MKQTNQYSIPEQNNANFIRRFLIYQKERFPFIGHGLLISAFTFSAIGYARICRGVEGFIDWNVFLPGVFTTFTLFFLLRISDEFKDAEDDAKYRKELPVPRGLISLKELKRIGLIILFLQLFVNIFFFPKMLVLYGIAILYLFLMWKEFFIVNWLKKHQFWYVVSHMFIIPLIDIYASGLDWFLVGVAAPTGLLFFFAVSYMNGIVIEVGRKIRTKEQESEGVLTYTAMLGQKKALYLYILVLIGTFTLAVLATYYAGFMDMAFGVLLVVLILCLLPALSFIVKPTQKKSKIIEVTSGIWTIAMYLTLGGLPMLNHLLLN